jgi:hypothetical protein
MGGITDNDGEPVGYSITQTVYGTFLQGDEREVTKFIAKRFEEINFKSRRD